MNFFLFQEEKHRCHRGGVLFETRMTFSRQHLASETFRRSTSKPTPGEGTCAQVSGVETLRPETELAQGPGGGQANEVAQESFPDDSVRPPSSIPPIPSPFPTTLPAVPATSTRAGAPDTWCPPAPPEARPGSPGPPPPHPGLPGIPYFPSFLTPTDRLALIPTGVAGSRRVLGVRALSIPVKFSQKTFFLDS